MKTVRIMAASAVGKDGTFYAIGGAYTDVFKLVEAWKPGEAAWTAVAPLSAPRLGLAAAADRDGKIYALGGSDGMGTEPVSQPTVEIFDPVAGSWSMGAPMATERYEPAAVLGSDGAIYAIGGHGAMHATTNSVERYDPKTSQWSPVANMIHVRAGHAAAVGRDGRDLRDGRPRRGGFPGARLDGGLRAEARCVAQLALSSSQWTSIAQIGEPPSDRQSCTRGSQQSERACRTRPRRGTRSRTRASRPGPGTQQASGNAHGAPSGASPAPTRWQRLGGIVGMSSEQPPEQQSGGRPARPVRPGKAGPKGMRSDELHEIRFIVQRVRAGARPPNRPSRPPRRPSKPLGGRERILRQLGERRRGFHPGRRCSSPWLPQASGRKRVFKVVRDDRLSGGQSVQRPFPCARTPAEAERVRITVLQELVALRRGVRLEPLGLTFRTAADDDAILIERTKSEPETA